MCLLHGVYGGHWTKDCKELTAPQDILNPHGECNYGYKGCHKQHPPLNLTVPENTKTPEGVIRGFVSAPSEDDTSSIAGQDVHTGDHIADGNKMVAPVSIDSELDTIIEALANTAADYGMDSKFPPKFLKEDAKADLKALIAQAVEERLIQLIGKDEAEPYYIRQQIEVNARNKLRAQLRTSAKRKETN